MNHPAQPPLRASCHPAGGAEHHTDEPAVALAGWVLRVGPPLAAESERLDQVRDRDRALGLDETGIVRSVPKPIASTG
jgi:hypothetical protein